MWKNGKNLDETIADIQTNLDDVRLWCVKWGFILSKDKTVAIIFSRCDKQTDSKLSIDKVDLKWSKEVKFLGVIFDDRLTWKAHINYVADRCKSRLNLMRCISGTNWGADKKSLFHIYQALIRSVIDYGCEAYHSASSSVLSKLDRIQSYALRICCGAMKCSPVSALQVECGEKPLELRRESFQLKYAIKVKTIKDHPAAGILKERKPIKREKSSFSKKTKPFLMELKYQIEGPNVPNFPPWRNTKPDVNIKLQTLTNKKMPPEIKNNVVSKFISNYDDHIKCFTDGSISSQGDAGAGYFIPSLDVKQSFALSKNINILSAELIPIRETLIYIHSNPQIEKYVIFSDSLGAISSIKSGISMTRPNLLIEIQNLITKVSTDNKRVTFVWLPGHTNIEGNDVADFLSKEKRSNPVPDIIVPFELKETYAQVDQYIMKKWQDRWDNGITGRIYHKIENKVSDKIKFSKDIRSDETTITRMRLGKCGLNFYLFKLKKHANGLCDTCHQPETIEHFLKLCRKNSELIDKLSSACKTMNIPYELDIILSNNELINIILKYIKTLNRKF
jgi:ribonuclease HI